MLGKAKDVKIESFNFIEEYREWQQKHPDYTVIDLRFQESYEGSILLIIYKESEAEGIECPKCRDPFCIGDCKEE